jgi:hypothetical protein
MRLSGEGPRCVWCSAAAAISRSRNMTDNTNKTKLQLETLESREVPAIAVQLDYSFDSAGFFNDPTRRAILQQAVNNIASQIDANLPAIVAPPGTSWSQTFYNPANGQQASVFNPVVPENTLVIYVGGRSMGGPAAAFGGSGGYSAAGSQAWYNALAARGPGGSLLWGGSMTFDSNTDWFFGNSISGIGRNQVDFMSVAEHEFGHVLGIGTAARWFNQSSGGYFHGPASKSIYGGPVPLSPDNAHWADGVTIGGKDSSFDPTIPRGTRVSLNSLDYAGLKDLGWSVSGSSLPVFSQDSLSVAPVPIGSSLLELVVPPSGNGNGCDCSSCRLVALTGTTDGSAQIFQATDDGTLLPAGPRFQPFPGFAGVIRTTMADFDGDGITDFAFATGNGVTGTVRIISGATGKDLVAPTTVLDGFSGGIFLAAGDVDRNGRAELVVSADMGGGPRVTLFKVENNALRPVLDFIAFDLPDFRGGSRVALADINKDGAADLLIGAGIGGGPRVSIYDGNSLLSGNLQRLVPDFFALDPNLRSGVFITAADVNGDGYADVLYSTGNTGGPRVRVVSGYVLMNNPGADVTNLPALADFFALDEHDRSGLRIMARDLDGDGAAELIVASGSKNSPAVRIIPFGEMNQPRRPLQNPFGDPTTIDGIYVG